MSERKADAREKEWADEIPDEDGFLSEFHEDTGRDGSADDDFRAD